MQRVKQRFARVVRKIAKNPSAVSTIFFVSVAATTFPVIEGKRMTQLSIQETRAISLGINECLKKRKFPKIEKFQGNFNFSTPLLEASKVVVGRSKRERMSFRGWYTYVRDARFERELFLFPGPLHRQQVHRQDSLHKLNRF